MTRERREHIRRIDGEFTFQVGAFFENGVAGWSPSAANADEWADHWLAADSAASPETAACESIVAPENESTAEKSAAIQAASPLMAAG